MKIKKILVESRDTLYLLVKELDVYLFPFSELADNKSELSV